MGRKEMGSQNFIKYFQCVLVAFIRKGEAFHGLLLNIMFFALMNKQAVQLT